jgi:uncharacterized membrane protein YgcG
MMDVYLLYALGAATVLGICIFMWPRRRPEPHLFGAKVNAEAEFRRDLLQRKADADFQRSIRKEIKRANRVRSKPPVTSVAPVSNRNVDRDNGSDFLTGVVIGAAVNSIINSSSKSDDTSSSSGSFSGGGGEFSGAGASGSWDSGSSDSSSSSSGGSE